MYRARRVANGACVHVRIHRRSPIGRAATGIKSRRENAKSPVRTRPQHGQVCWSPQVRSMLSSAPRSNMRFICLGTASSEWSPWTDCQGVPCQIGRQQRMLACLHSSVIDGKTSMCNGEQIQEQDCRVPCANQTGPAPAPVRPFSKGTRCMACASFYSLLIRRRVHELDAMVGLSTVGLHGHTHAPVLAGTMPRLRDGNSTVQRQSLLK